MQDFARTFYSSKAWKDCRKAYTKSKGGLCERCFANGLITPGEIVHHKIHLTPDNINDPKVSLNTDLLCLLCRECHAKEHTANKKRFSVDEMGRITARV